MVVNNAEKTVEHEGLLFVLDEAQLPSAAGCLYLCVACGKAATMPACLVQPVVRYGQASCKSGMPGQSATDARKWAVH